MILANCLSSDFKHLTICSSYKHWMWRRHCFVYSRFLGLKSLSGHNRSNLGHNCSSRVRKTVIFCHLLPEAREAVMRTYHKTKRHHSVKTERRHSVTFQSPFSRLTGRYISVTIQWPFSAIQSPFRRLSVIFVCSAIQTCVLIRLWFLC